MEPLNSGDLALFWCSAESNLIGGYRLRPKKRVPDFQGTELSNGSSNSTFLIKQSLLFKHQNVLHSLKVYLNRVNWYPYTKILDK